MPETREIRINLLGNQDLEHTPWGRLVSWATTYGRYIMITTEIVVLLAFISRFSLDRKNTDLTEELTQKQAIIQANLEFEREIKSLQARLATTRKLMSDQHTLPQLINIIETLLPADVYLESFELNGSKLVVSGVAGTTGGFAQLMSNVQATKNFQNVMFGDIRRDPSLGIEFQLTADMGAKESK